MKRIAVLVVLVAVAAAALTACSGDDPVDDRTAEDAAAAISAAIPSVTKAVALTEDTDPNDLLGRPSGYDAATILYDKRVECGDGPGVDCGATIEQWSSDEEAKERAAYIEGFGALANEYHYISDGLLLRVSGELKPSEVEEYESAFAG